MAVRWFLQLTSRELLRKSSELSALKSSAEAHLDYSVKRPRWSKGHGFRRILEQRAGWAGRAKHPLNYNLPEQWGNSLEFRAG
jgi:hypothetical protein